MFSLFSFYCFYVSFSLTATRLTVHRLFMFAVFLLILDPVQGVLLCVLLRTFLDTVLLVIGIILGLRHFLVLPMEVRLSRGCVCCPSKVAYHAAWYALC